MPTYGELESKEDHEARIVFKTIMVSTKQKTYPEVVSNHFCYLHTVDDNNGWKNAPISIYYA